MIMYRRVPPGPLSGFVGLLWYCRGYSQARAKERLLPIGTVELVIDLASSRTSDSVVAGVRSEPYTIERAAGDHLLGVHFKPGGAFPFLRFPFGDLHNLDITLDDLWGATNASRLLVMLQEASSVEVMFQTLERWLIAAAVKPLEHRPAVAFGLQALQCVPSSRRTADVVAQAGLSQRRFIQLFRDGVGLTPKMFQRIQRFQQVLKAVHRQTNVDWARVALSCGYFDQSHLIRDFQAFSALTPTEYLAAHTENQNHVLIGG